ncbi:alpha-L-rhamnosidase [Bisporella sp. PMI_857]|nr:alpha-L-rhamnosidase [Bisporella sp. PMI_857]
MRSFLSLFGAVWLATVSYQNVLVSALKQTSQDVFLPQGVSVDNKLNVKTGPFKKFTLDTAKPIATIDYGVERAGYPLFSISSLDRPVQVEVKYSEAFIALEHVWSDGPYNFAVSLANAFRVETFNITTTGIVTSLLLQGGQRWQSIRLLTEGSITFEKVGFEASVDTTDVGELPGKFDSDNEKLNEIWKLGAVAASTACVEKGTQKSVWQVDPVKGIHLSSLRPAQTLNGAFFANYTLEFDAYIERGGIWWSVAWPLSYSRGIQLQLVSELPEATTFVNTNKTLTPPNSILLSYGYDFVNQTTLPTSLLGTFEVPFTVHEKTWHHVTTELSPNGFLSILLNEKLALNVSISEYYAGGSISFAGSFGFGAYQDQEVYVRNVVVTDTANGTTLYTNKMTSSDVLAEYGTQANLESVCLDGPKRDRLVWLGDFYHTVRIVSASTSRNDISKGTFDFFLISQLPNGQFNIDPPMGYDPSIVEPFAPTGSYLLSDYQILGLSALYSYIRLTNDLDFVRGTWSGWQLQMDWLISQISPDDGLIHVLFAFLGPGAGSSAVSCLAVQAFREMAQISDALGNETARALYTSHAEILTRTINARLWNDDLGVYSSAPSDPGNFSVVSTAFCITSGVANSTQTTRSIAALSQLQLWPGYKDSSAASTANPSTVISPNTNGFLLDALFQANASALGLSLINSLWGAMVANTSTSSGASWEYVDRNGSPGLSLFTSLAHPWGGAPTYILPEWGAGLRTARGTAGFGYRRWVVAPETGITMGLKRAFAQVETPSGVLSVSWKLGDSRGGKQDLHVAIEAPRDTVGTFEYADLRKDLSGESRYNFVARVACPV